MAVPELRAAGVFAATAPVRRADRGPLPRRADWASASSPRTQPGTPSSAGRSGTSRRSGSATGPRSSASTARVMEPLPAGPVRRASRHERLVRPRARSRRSTTSCARDAGRTGCTRASSSEASSSACDPDAVVEHDKDFDLGEFLSQRYHYSRSFAGMRNAELGGKRALYALGTPLLVPLLYWRMARNVFSRGRQRRQFLLATPLILLYVSVWAFGEAVGYVFGGGAQPAEGAMSDRASTRRAGQPPRLRSLRAERVGAARRARRDVDVHLRHRRGDRPLRPSCRPGAETLVVRLSRARRGGVGRVVPLAGRPAADRRRGLARTARRARLPSVYTYFPSLGVPTHRRRARPDRRRPPELTLPSRRARASGELKQRTARAAGATRVHGLRDVRGASSRRGFASRAAKLAVVPEAPDPVFGRARGRERSTRSSRSVSPRASRISCTPAASARTRTSRRCSTPSPLCEHARRTEARRRRARSTTRRTSRPRGVRARRSASSGSATPCCCRASCPTRRSRASTAARSRSCCRRSRRASACRPSRRRRAARRSCSATSPRTARRSATRRSSSRRGMRTRSRTPPAAARLGHAPAVARRAWPSRAWQRYTWDASAEALRGLVHEVARGAVAEPLSFCMVTTFYPPYHFGGDADARLPARERARPAGHAVTVVHSEDAYRALGGARAAGRVPTSRE